MRRLRLQEVCMLKGLRTLLRVGMEDSGDDAQFGSLKLYRIRTLNVLALLVGAISLLTIPGAVVAEEWLLLPGSLLLVSVVAGVFHLQILRCGPDDDLAWQRLGHHAVFLPWPRFWCSLLVLATDAFCFNILPSVRKTISVCSGCPFRWTDVVDGHD